MIVAVELIPTLVLLFSATTVEPLMSAFVLTIPQSLFELRIL